ncbi:pilus assembly FimT family protein [Mitsuokella multacida]|uniref:pilus assembly FimT family protein n=1 Tax=Mitsuokella multacida TaxID=52226 RepID=UPI002666CC05|nr:hypothetical protein [Mitsuokella multacida]
MREQGSLLIELIIACAVLVILSMAALPRGLTLYREAALEYEVQHLLGDIRYMRGISRTTQIWPQSMKRKADQQLPPWRQAQMQFRRTGYTMRAGNVTHRRYDFLPGIELKGRFVTGSLDGPALTFGNDGLLTTPCTMVLFWTDAPQSGRKLILSAGGRCRVERRLQ